MAFLMRILDLIFPRKCLACRAEGGYVCEQCWSLVKLRRFQQCPVCRRRSDRGFSCCDGDISRLVVTAEYRRGDILSRLIVQFKYKFALELAEKLGALLKIFAGEFEGFLIVPVPLDKRKMRQRGFNQAEILASYLGPVFDCLEREYKPVHQAGADRAARLGNLAGLFGMRVGFSVLGRKVLLVDDVATTGTTLSECARVLREAGASTVAAIVLARGR